MAAWLLIPIITSTTFPQVQYFGGVRLQWMKDKEPFIVSLSLSHESTQWLSFHNDYAARICMAACPITQLVGVPWCRLKHEARQKQSSAYKMSNGSRHIFNYQRLPKIKRTLYDSSPNFGPKQQLGWLGHTPLQAMGKECNMILTIGPSFLLIRFWLEMACDAKRECQKIGQFSIKAAPRLQLSTPETEMLPFHSTWKA